MANDDIDDLLQEWDEGTSFEDVSDETDSEESGDWEGITHEEMVELDNSVDETEEDGWVRLGKIWVQ